MLETQNEYKNGSGKEMFILFFCEKVFLEKYFTPEACKVQMTYKSK